MRATIRREIDVVRSARVMQCEALFDVPPMEHSAQEWDVSLPIEERDWNVGLIVGPSGAGKSSVARDLFADALVHPHEWSRNAALVDEFPETMAIDEITQLLGATGLGSIPCWMRPYSTLSTGEQFRADVAYALATMGERLVVDEWTSTVDRTVAKVASAAAAKATRRREQQLIAVTCHYDVIDWLQPDWIFQPHSGDFTWRSVQPRPQVTIDIRPVDRSAWRVFHRHHYLSARLPPGECFGGFVGDECVAFAGVTHTVHPSPKVANLKRMARVVTLPDWQGIGIGSAFIDAVAGVVAAREMRVRILTAHPGIVRHCLASARWADLSPRRLDAAERVLVAQTTGFQSGPNADPGLARQAGQLRRLAVRTFEYSRPVQSRSSARSRR